MKTTHTLTHMRKLSHGHMKKISFSMSWKPFFCRWKWEKLKSLYLLNSKFQALSHLQWLHSPVSDWPGWKPPANYVSGWVYCFHVVSPSFWPSVCLLHFLSLISWKILDRISSNFANTFICTRQILLIKN